MKEHPILFNTEMVKAILDGKKTQTRRVIKPQPADQLFFRYGRWGNVWLDDVWLCPYGQVGDRLWVRETHWLPPLITEKMLRDGADTWPTVIYSNTNIDFESLREWGWKQKPSIHMFRKDSRITLEITEVRVERVQEISLGDVKAEGMTTSKGQNIVYGLFDNFEKLWDSFNAKRGFGWDSNPWCWVISFKEVRSES